MPDIVPRETDRCRARRPGICSREEADRSTAPVGAVGRGRRARAVRAAAIGAAVRPAGGALGGVRSAAAGAVGGPVGPTVRRLAGVRRAAVTARRLFAGAGLIAAA